MDGLIFSTFFCWRVCSFAGVFHEFCPDFESIFFQISYLGGCPQMYIFLLLISLNVDFYIFRSSHRVEGFLSYGNNSNICTIIDYSKLGVEIVEKGCGGFNFWCSCRPTVFSSAGEWTPLQLVLKNFVLIFVLKYTSRWLLLKVLIVVKFCDWKPLVWSLRRWVWADIQLVLIFNVIGPFNIIKLCFLIAF